MTAVPSTFTGWRRANGRVGIRNHVVLLSLDSGSDAVAATLSARVPGLTLVGSRFGASAQRDLHLRTLIGTGSNPNVASVTILATDVAEPSPIMEGIARSGQEVDAFRVDAGQDLIGHLQARVQSAAQQQQVRASVSDLWISTKCEQSDATTSLASCPTVGSMFDRLIACGACGVLGETPELVGLTALVASRAADPAVAAKWTRVRQARIDRRADERRAGREQPTAENIAHGITTIEEKSLGSFAKAGRDHPILDVLGPAEAPSAQAGLHLMDTSSETDCIDHMVAAGFVVHVHASGVAGPVDHPIVPVLQINGNPFSVADAPELIDIDVSGILKGTLTVEQAADNLIGALCRAASGTLTIAERRIRKSS